MRNSLAFIIATEKKVEDEIKKNVLKILNGEETEESELKKMETLFMIHGEHITRIELIDILSDWTKGKIERRLIK